MKNFTRKELDLICIYDPGTRNGLISDLIDMTGCLMPDEAELRRLAESVITKLRCITDEEYAKMIGSIDFDPKEDSHAG